MNQNIRGIDMLLSCWVKPLNRDRLYFKMLYIRIKFQQS